MTRRMQSFVFCIARPDGSERIERFYAPTKAQAAKYAHAWAQRMGYEVVEERTT